LPPEHIKTEIKRQIAALAAQGRPTVELEKGQVTVTFPDQPAFGDPGAPLSAPSGSATKLLCWLFGDQIIDRLNAGVDSVTGGLTRHEREVPLDELRAELLKLERQEEALVAQGLHQGLDVHRRPGASPLALLGLEPAPALLGVAAAE
jgi:hypothetical protein